eukprot:gene1135-10649_t
MNITISKIEEFKNLIVIKPSYIIDSIKEDKLLAENEYLLEISKSATSYNTLQNSNFISNYFNSSRLHFIGSWKEKIATENKVQNTSNLKFVAHVDMDCFFASIVMKENPSLKDVPIAISYSKNGNGDIASCNYKAREFGVKAGMWMISAKKLCPNLKSFPYEFEKYERVSLIVNDIFQKYCSRVKVLSIDEAYLDLTEECKTKQDCIDLISKIRNEIEFKTGCTCSSGISYNLLLARLGTKKSKPNGQIFIDKESSLNFLKNFEISDLPGVGRKLKKKIENELNMQYIHQILNVNKNQLQNICGKKKGENVYNYARGLDSRKLDFENIRKSVGFDINWGIRFEKTDEILKFFQQLSIEISTRLKSVQVKGKHFSLKLKISKDGENETKKYLGCGYCDDVSKSFSFNHFIDDSILILKKLKETFLEMNINPKLLRGISIHVSKLNNENQKNFKLSDYFDRNQKKKSTLIFKENEKELPPLKKKKILQKEEEKEEKKEKYTDNINNTIEQLFKKENFKDVIKLISDYLDKQNEKNINFFMELVLQYLIQLIEEMFHLEEIEKILKFLERKLMKKIENVEWIQNLEKLKNIIKEKINEKYA